MAKRDFKKHVKDEQAAREGQRVFHEREDAAAIVKLWKQGAHKAAADMVVEGGRDAFNGLIKAIPDDEKLIRETLGERGVY